MAEDKAIVEMVAGVATAEEVEAEVGGVEEGAAEVVDDGHESPHVPRF